MNEVIQQLYDRKSVRFFTEQPITKEEKADDCVRISTFREDLKLRTT